MGAVNANAVISNPADRNKSWEGVFLVDTGATDSLVPRQHLEAIGLKPEAQRTYLLADGSEVEMDIAIARIELMGEIVGSTVLFGEADTEPLLGVTALESLGIEVDPLNQRLKKLPAVRLKSLRTRSRKEEQHGSTTAALQQSDKSDKLKNPHMDRSETASMSGRTATSIRRSRSNRRCSPYPSAF